MSRSPISFQGYIVWKNTDIKKKKTQETRHDL